MMTNKIETGMNINKIVNQDNALFSCLKKGDKLSGVIIDITTDKVKVDFSNKSYLLAKEKFTDDELKLGNKLEFKVINVRGDKTELEKITNGISNEDILKSATDGLVDAKSVFESYDFVESKDDEEVDADEQTENTKSISKNIYEESIRKLLDYEDFNIMKISMQEFIEMVIDYNIKSLSGLKTDDNLISNIKDNSLDLPKQLLNNMINIFEKVDSIKNLKEDDVERITFDLLKNNDFLSLNKIYETQYKVYEREVVPEFDVNNFEDNIKSLIENENIEYTKDNVEVAKKLIVNQVDITKDNFARFNEIKNAIKNIDEKDAINKYIDMISLDEQIDDVCLENENRIDLIEKQINESIDIVSKDDNKLQLIIDANKGKVSSATLMDVEDAALVSKQDLSVDLDKTNQLRLKLNEVRLMFTAKSAYAIYSKGIDVELAPIKETLKELKIISSQIEMQNKGELLNKVSNVTNDIKVRNFAIYKNIDEIKNQPLMQVAKLCREKIETTVNDLSKEYGVKYSHEDVVNGYDNNMITSRYTLKGEYNIANRNVDELLKSAGIENSDINKKCAIILSLSGRDVDADNINSIKNLEAKLDYIVNNATPKVVKTFIDEGVDITTLTIEDLENRITQKVEELKVLDNEANINNKEKLVDSICDVIAADNISPEVKDALLGVYKIINKISKYGNAGAGILGHNEDELNFTLREVFDATKVLEKTRSGNAINKKIDDAFGVLQDLVENDSNAKKTLDRSFATIRQELKKDSKLISSEDINKLISFAKDNEDVLDKFYDDLNNVTLEQVKLVKDFEDSKKLIKDNVLTSSLISNSDEIKEEVNKLSSKAKGGNLKVIEEKNHIEALKQIRDKDAQYILERFETETEDAEETIDVTNRILATSENELMRIESINKVLRLAYNEDGPKESNMQVPVIINDELTNINLIFNDEVRNDINDIKMLISIDLPNIGSTKVNIELDKDKNMASFDFIFSDKDAISEIIKSSSEIINMIEDSYHVSSISINGNNINSLRKEVGNLYLRNKKIN